MTSIASRPGSRTQLDVFVAPHALRYQQILPLLIITIYHFIQPTSPNYLITPALTTCVVSSLMGPVH